MVEDHLSQLYPLTFLQSTSLTLLLNIMGRLTFFRNDEGSPAPIECIPPEIFRMIVDSLKEIGNHTDQLVLRMTSPACYLKTPPLPRLGTKAWDRLHTEFEGRVEQKKLQSLLCWKCHKLLGKSPSRRSTKKTRSLLSSSFESQGR